MPTIPLDPQSPGKWPAVLQGIMVDPTGKHGDRLPQAMARATTIEVAGRHKADAAVMTMFGPGLIEAARGERIEDYLRETKLDHESGDLLRGDLSSLILLHVLTQATSLTDSYQAIAAAFAFRRRGGSERRLKDIWRDFSPAAHLWATFRWKYESLPDWWQPEHLRLWLGDAEALRRLGEHYTLPHSRSALLDPKRTWQVPAEIKLPTAADPLPPKNAFLEMLQKARQRR